MKEIPSILRELLETYSARVIERQDVIVVLDDAVLVFEKGGKGEAPVRIRIEPVDLRLDATVREVFGKEVEVTAQDDE